MQTAVSKAGKGSECLPLKQDAHATFSNKRRQAAGIHVPKKHA